MGSSLVSIHLIVKDGERYIRKCLEAALNQDFKNFEVLVFDNNSKDKTREIVEREFLLSSDLRRPKPTTVGEGRILGEGGPETKLIKFDENYGLGGGFNRSIQYSNLKYIVLLCVDVILAPNFLKEAIKILEKDSKIGTLQPKILIWDFKNNGLTNIIDTTGFEIFKSRRIINRGHGEEDKNQHTEGEIFSYEGACPIFRREALEDAKIPPNNEYLDEDFEWYADDIDLGWRMRLLGWKSYFSPKVVAYHDRQTTKRLKKSKTDFIKLRKDISAKKRMLDFRNQRLAMVKNDFSLHFLKDFPYFFLREIQLLSYFLFFEQTSLLAIPGFLKLLPKMLKKRRLIMKKKRVLRKEIEKWFK